MMRKLLIILFITACIQTAGWQRLPDMPEPKGQFGFECLNGILYAVGGTKGSTESIHTGTAFRYESSCWSQIASVPYKMQSPILRACGEKLYIIGGYDSKTKIKYPYVFEYNPTDNEWMWKADMPTAREDMGSVVVGSAIWIFGGITNPGHKLTRNIEVYDTISNSWESAGLMLMSRALGDFAASYGTKTYFVVGTETMSGYPTLYPEGNLVSFDTNNLSFSFEYRSIPFPRCYSEAETINGRIYVVGGAVNNVRNVTNSVQVYDVERDEWKAGLNLPYRAMGLGLTHHRNRLFACGGWCNDQKGTVSYLYFIDVE